MHTAAQVKRAIRARGKQPEHATDNAEDPKPKARGRPRKKTAKAENAEKPEQSTAASSTAQDNKPDDTGSKDDGDAKQPATPSKDSMDKGEDSTEDPAKRKAEDQTTPNKGGPRKRKTKKDTAAKAADDEAVKTAWKAQD